MNMHVLERGEYLPIEPTAEAEEWYLLDVYVGRESKVMRWFRYFGLDGWYPVEVTHVRRGLGGGEARKPHLGRRVVKPLVPGLIFVPSTECSDRMLTFPDVEGFHRIGDCLARLTPRDIATLRDIEAYLNAPRVGRGKRAHLCVGDAVRILEGPLADFVGRIERLDSRGRLKVFINAITRGVSVTTSETQVEQIDGTAIATGVARR
jgi:transcriptional antiterminator NusG